ncbi:hypothetical protein GE09DRAFT_397980 [Coniochaeta sp. 2T2.1]|nr:hypothetical protein GE09DRAFT_397980 [Coniochaeta sp. 2T2.1]
MRATTTSMRRLEFSLSSIVSTVKIREQSCARGSLGRPRSGPHYAMVRVCSADTSAFNAAYLRSPRVMHDFFPEGLTTLTAYRTSSRINAVRGCRRLAFTGTRAARNLVRLVDLPAVLFSELGSTRCQQPTASCRNLSESFLVPGNPQRRPAPPLSWLVVMELISVDRAVTPYFIRGPLDPPLYSIRYVQEKWEPQDAVPRCGWFARRVAHGLRMALLS